MLSTLRNAWKVPDLKKRMIFTLLMVAIMRMGIYIPVPGVDASKLVDLTSNGGTLISFYDLMSGGALSKFSIFAMGVGPYITASIIMQLLVIAVPYLEQLSKEGVEGRKRIQDLTRYVSIVLGALQALGMYAVIAGTGAFTDTSSLAIFLVILTMTTASTFLVWIGEQITGKGIGNGISLIIFINMVSGLPSTVYKISELQKAGTVNFVEVIMFIVVAIALLVAVVIASLGERRIPVQYAGKAVGNKVFKGQSTHIPIGVTASAVIGIIFAMSVMTFPETIAQLKPTSSIAKFIVGSPWSIFEKNSWKYSLVYFVLIVFFTWFYTQVTFKPDEMAENMHKSSGFIPGIRPGENTATYIDKVLTKVSILGGTFAAVIAIFPIFIEGYTHFKGIYFGGTMLLIMVNVALETLRQLESQLVMRHYQGFLK
ncbi:preprotein translocase subunit SecY [Clostridium sp. CF011]|uniref:preprotein translocase subunit SecY n=1 Tax=Clostridium sp. CF011 TaxID=2843318 RepID=UPI001C0D30B3|nr:preprotein translocase subunit SecY [Clostridium sp. CF011]MBU3091380.1 preprotein translocase subunit SecY [Clostridium sp. CF011]WAG69193.1 preprotein translocase subunit SecY [Clostridium sp. CF011]